VPVRPSPSVEVISFCNASWAPALTIAHARSERCGGDTAFRPNAIRFDAYVSFDSTAPVARPIDDDYGSLLQASSGFVLSPETSRCPSKARVTPTCRPPQDRRYP
jgi:hypothetical protein